MIGQLPIFNRQTSFEFGAAKHSPKAYCQVQTPQSPLRRPSNIPPIPIHHSNNTSISYRYLNQTKTQDPFDDFKLKLTSSKQELNHLANP